MPELDYQLNNTNIKQFKNKKMKKLILMALVVVFGTTMGLQAQTAKQETIKIKTNAYTAKSDEIFKESIPKGRFGKI